MTPTDHQIRLLLQLKRGVNFMLAAGEHDDASALENMGYVVTWQTGAGFLAWRITAAGQRYLKDRCIA